MKKGLHPQLQYVSYVTPSGRLMSAMMTKAHNVSKVYHLRAKRQMIESIGQLAKFRRRYEMGNDENAENAENVENAEKKWPSVQLKDQLFAWMVHSEFVLRAWPCEC